MGSYSKAKREKIDFCNICGEKSALTWDHVPPQSCLNSVPVKFNHLMRGLPEFNKYEASSQNGVKFRSLCSNCNNNLLGAEYDKELTRFTSAVLSHLQDSVEQLPPGLVNVSDLPQFVGTFKVNRIARAICGHILAAKNEYDNQTLPDVQLRKYFLNPTALPPKDYHLLMWFYPYSTITIARDFIAKKISATNDLIPEGMCSIVSSFPLAYLLCDDQYTGTLCSLFDLCSREIDDETPVTFDFASCLLKPGILRHPLWPAYVSSTDGGVDMILTSKYTVDSSVFGIRHLEKR